MRMRLRAPSAAGGVGDGRRKIVSQRPSSQPESPLSESRSTDNPATLRQADRQATARAELVLLQTQVRAVELRMEQVRTEVAGLAGLSLSGLMYGLLGQKSRRLDEARQTYAELERQHAEQSVMLASLEREVAELTRLVDAGLAPRGVDHATISNDAVKSPMLERIEQAIAACQEAARDLRDEMEVHSMAGRVRLVGGHRAIRAVMRVGRSRTADECAERVRRSIARFQRLIGGVLGGSEVDGEMLTVDRDLARAAAEINGRWIESGATSGASLEWLAERLGLADMLLERKLRDAQATPTTDPPC